MDKRGRKSSQKQFMQTMIIAGVLGLSVMMVAMLYMIKLFGPKKATVLPEDIMPTTENQSKEEVDTEEIKGVVHEIGSTRKNIKIWDIQNQQYVTVLVKEKAHITDAYGKPMSAREIGLGDMIDVTYETRKQEVLTLQKSANAWTKSDVTGIEVIAQDKTIKIGNTTYRYTTDIMITNDDLETVDISEINSLDALEIKGVGDTIWSIQVVRAAGYLQLSHIPTTKGTIEIGNNKFYRLEEIDENIPLPGGQHKIVVRMEGYRPFVKQITISTNQIQVLDLREAEVAVANLKINVVNTEVDYKVQIDGKVYKKDEAITLKPGQYTLKLKAEGFKQVQMEIRLEEGDRIIRITVQPEEEESTPETQQQNTTQQKPTSQNPTVQTPAPSKPTPEKPKPAPPVEEIKNVQIIIETDPADAKVFINGVYKGETPAVTGLKPGEYSITIEKDGYTSLYSTIIIDASNAQKGFLYTLQKE